MDVPDYVLCGATVHEYSHATCCTHLLCEHKEECVTNYSISTILTPPPFTCKSQCKLGNDAKLCSTFCANFKNIELKLEKANLRGVLATMADVVFDRNGVLCEEKTTCDLVILNNIGGVGTVLNTNPIFSTSRNFRKFSKTLRTHVIEYTVAAKGVMYSHTGSVQERHEKHNARRAVMFRHHMKRKFKESDIVPNGVGTIMYNLEGSRNTVVHNRTLSLKGHSVGFQEPQHVTTYNMENAMHAIGGAQNDQEGEIQMCFPCNINIIQPDGTCSRLFIDKGDRAIIAKKTSPGVLEHCTWDQIQPRAYISYQTLPLHMEQKDPPEIDNLKFDVVFDKEINNDLFVRRTQRARMSDALDRQPIEFMLPIPFRFSIFHEEYKLIDPNEAVVVLTGEWAKMSGVAEGEKYILSMLFGDNVALDLLEMSEKYCARDDNHSDFAGMEKLNLMHSLYANLYPMFSYLRDICMDLAMCILKFSTGTFWHRERIHELISLITYIHNMAILDADAELHEHLHLNFPVPNECTAHIKTLRSMHLDFRLNVMPEIFGDFIFDIFLGGGIFTFDPSSARTKIDEKRDNLLQLCSEASHRIGREFANDDERLRRIIMILKKPNGIYNHTKLDDRIYDIRDAVKLNSNQSVLCVLVNSFVLKCKTNRKYKRVVVDPNDDSFRLNMFVFLNNVKNCLNASAEKLIDLELKRVHSFDLTCIQAVERILEKNTVRMCPSSLT
jgi:hypothetical protein